MDDPKQILVERDGHVARVTINRPNRRNALSFAAWQSLAAAFDNLAADPEVRVVVLTGAGERAFCAGNDISEFAEKRSTPEQIEAYDAVLSHAYQVIRDFEKPLVARVRGFAVG
ncbi:MAG: enoyl-CoA hydratase/isomerase family protein, partial [Alphaproteobacteria bacterium]|nr:enoyl-CoA hydratase/isomerase family protein [Alphaproteobacteria bacterium]